MTAGILPLPSLTLGSLKRSQSAVLPIGHKIVWNNLGRLTGAGTGRARDGAHQTPVGSHPKHPGQKRPHTGAFFFCLERVMGIEPTLCAWEAQVLPLNYTRALSEIFSLASLPSRSAFNNRLSVHPWPAAHGSWSYAPRRLRRSPFTH